MTKRGTLAAIAAVLVMSGAAAAHGGEEPAKPGTIGAGSPFYMIDTGWDSAMMGLGFKHAADVAEERAAEARQASENNNTEAMDIALEKFSAVAEVAKRKDTHGIEKAASVLRQIQRQRKGDSSGIDKALENMGSGTRNRSERGQGSNETGENLTGYTGTGMAEPAPPTEAR